MMYSCWTEKESPDQSELVEADYPDDAAEQYAKSYYAATAGESDLEQVIFCKNVIDGTIRRFRTYIEFEPTVFVQETEE